jgi:hypothetical protein
MKLEFLADMLYTTKLIAGVMSGFDDLQTRVGKEWKYCAYTRTVTRDPNGLKSGGICYHYNELPHYICVRWNNGHHFPLPVILMDDDSNEYKLQSLAARALHWLAFNTSRCASFRQAFIACAHYKDQFETEAEER